MTFLFVLMLYSEAELHFFARGGTGGQGHKSSSLELKIQDGNKKFCVIIIKNDKKN